MIKFNKHHVVDTDTKVKARVFYSLDGRNDGRKCVRLYAKDYDRRTLGKLISHGYINESDMQTDYFELGKVIMFENHPLYAKAREMAESLKRAKELKLCK